MRFCYAADVPWWCIGRHGTGLQKYNQTEHSWEVVHIEEPRGAFPGWLEGYDAVVLGSVPAFALADRFGLVPQKPRKILRCGSFRDAAMRVLISTESAEESDVSEAFRRHRIDALAYIDHRMAPALVGYGLPMIYCPGRIDHEVFYPAKSSASGTDGPIRVGWAGSEASWTGVKHVDLICQAAEAVGVELVLQRRETDGCKTAEEMRDWYAGLDLYVSANEELSPPPMPSIEAAACATAVITTRCGELWPYINAVEPNFVLESPSLTEIQRALNLAQRIGRPGLRRLGHQLGRIVRERFTWLSGEAGLFTRSIEAVCRRG